MEGIVLGVTALAMALADGRPQDELAVMATAFTQLGDTLATIAAIRDRDSNAALAAKDEDPSPGAKSG